MGYIICNNTPQILAAKGGKAQWRCKAVFRNNLHHRNCQCCTRAHTLRGQRGQRFSRLSVAAVEDPVTTDGDVDDLEEESPAAETDDNAAKDVNRYDDRSEYRLNFLWMDKNVGVAVDQVFAKNMRSPVTEYYFWPRKDAWEELKIGIESKPWISYRDKVTMLNTTTEVINFWQTEGTRPTAEQAREKFPDCFFRGQ